jgi:hypothetical protein
MPLSTSGSTRLSRVPEPSSSSGEDACGGGGGGGGGGVSKELMNSRCVIGGRGGSGRCTQHQSDAWGAFRMCTWGHGVTPHVRVSTTADAPSPSPARPWRETNARCSAPSQRGSPARASAARRPAHVCVCVHVCVVEKREGRRTCVLTQEWVDTRAKAHGWWWWTWLGHTPAPACPLG